MIKKRSNTRLKRAKQNRFDVFQLMILAGKFEGKSDQQIADELGVNRNTIWRNRKRIEESEFITGIRQALMSMGDLAVEATRANLINAEPYFLAKFLSGLGILRDKIHIEGKVDIAETKAKLSDTLDRVYGFKPSRIDRRVVRDVAKARVELDKELEAEREQALVEKYKQAVSNGGVIRDKAWRDEIEQEQEQEQDKRGRVTTPPPPEEDN